MSVWRPRCMRLMAAVLVASLGVAIPSRAFAQIDALIGGILGELARQGGRGLPGARGGPFPAPGGAGREGPMAGGLPEDGPSFDCRYAASPATVTICRDRALSRLDRSMAAAYAAASRVGGRPQTLRAEQGAWLRRRDRCQGSVACLHREMTARTAELRDLGPREAPSEDGLEARPGFGTASGPGDPDAGGLARLANPPPVLRPWTFETFNDRPALTNLNRYRPGSGESDRDVAKRFFVLLAAGAVPNFLDRFRNNAGPVIRLVDPAAAAPFLASGRTGLGEWAGNSPLARERARDAFFSRFKGPIAEAAPRMPLRLTWIEQAHLRDYDRGSGGFPVTSMTFSSDNARGSLGLSEVIRSADLEVAQPFRVPPLFWPLERRAAEEIQQREKWQTVELVADLVVRGIDEAGRVELELRRLDLYDEGHRTRLHTLAAPGGTPMGEPRPVEAVDAAGRPGEAVAARQWDVPMLGGLPFLTAAEFGAAQVEVPFGQGDRDAAGLPARPRRDRWARMVRAMALAAAGDTLAVSDEDATRLACMFLPRMQQVAQFEQDACRFGTAQPGSEFQRRDGAAAFRSRSLAAVAARAPRLPLRMRVAVPVSVGHYDSAGGAFPLASAGYDTGGPPLIFGSPLDVVLPRNWPVPEARARQYVATQNQDRGAQAWLGLEVTIVGVTPPAGRAGLFENAAALPDRRLWLYRTQSVGLFLDGELRTRLHTYDPDEVRLAQPVAASTAAPAGPVRVGGELALLAALALPGDRAPPVNWAEAAASRFRFEQSFRNRTDWRRIDAWGVFFPVAPDAAAVERYRQWSLARAREPLQDLSLEWLLSPYAATARPARLPVFDNDLLKVGGFNGTDITSSSPDDDLLRRMRARGIDRSQIVSTRLAMAGNDRVAAFVALPAPPGEYVVDLASRPPGFTAGGPQPTMTVEAAFAGAEVLRDGDRAAVVLRITPRSVAFHQGGRALARYELPVREWSAPAPALPSAEERLAGGPYGPEMLGLRLGMPMQQAEALIRRHLDHLRVLEAHALNDGQALAPAHGRLFMDTETREAIAIFDWPPFAEGRLLVVWRSLPVPRGTWPTILESTLSTKYGKPAATEDQAAFWSRMPTSEATTGNCLLGSGGGAWRWKEGGADASLSSLAAEAPESPRLREGQTAGFEGCGPVLHVRNPQLMVGTTVPLESTLYDLDVQALLARRGRQASAPPQKPMAPIKF